MQPFDDTTRDRFSAFLAALAPPVTKPPSDLARAIRELPEPYLLPSPWTVWLLIALSCYHRLQQRLERVVRRILPPSQDLLDQEQPVTLDLNKTGSGQGTVELEYRCDFGETTKCDGVETVTFGLTSQTNGLFFADVFISTTVTHGDASSRRLRELNPSSLTTHFGLSDLKAAGLVEDVSLYETFLDPDVEPDAYRLTAPVLWHRLMIERFCGRWVDERQHLWLAASIGDWLKAHELAESTGATDVLKVTGARAAWQRRERVERTQRTLAIGVVAE